MTWLACAERVFAMARALAALRGTCARLGARNACAAPRRAPLPLHPIFVNCGTRSTLPYYCTARTHDVLHLARH